MAEIVYLVDQPTVRAGTFTSTLLQVVRTNPILSFSLYGMSLLPPSDTCYDECEALGNLELLKYGEMTVHGLGK